MPRPKPTALQDAGLWKRRVPRPKPTGFCMTCDSNLLNRMHRRELPRPKATVTRDLNLPEISFVGDQEPLVSGLGFPDEVK